MIYELNSVSVFDENESMSLQSALIQCMAMFISNHCDLLELSFYLKYHGSPPHSIQSKQNDLQ